MRGAVCEGRVLAISANPNPEISNPGRALERDELLREGYQLRQDVCEALLARRQELEPFIVGRFDVYVDNMMREGSWGGACMECGSMLE